MWFSRRYDTKLAKGGLASVVLAALIGLYHALIALLDAIARKDTAVEYAAKLKPILASWWLPVVFFVGGAVILIVDFERRRRSSVGQLRPHLHCSPLQSMGVYHLIPNGIGIGVIVGNDETRFQTTAHNLRANIAFRHSLGDTRQINPGVWIDNKRAPNGTIVEHFSESVSLGMGEQRILLLVIWPNNWTGAASEFEPSARQFGGHPLEYGEWSVDMVFKADNAEQRFTTTVRLIKAGQITFGQIRER